MGLGFDRMPKFLAQEKKNSDSFRMNNIKSKKEEEDETFLRKLNDKSRI